MGYILEPEGVDFVVLNRPYTAKDEAKVRAFIQKEKALRAKRTPDTPGGVSKAKKSPRSHSQKS
jgi:hypothetical protein